MKNDVEKLKEAVILFTNSLDPIEGALELSAKKMTRLEGQQRSIIRFQYAITGLTILCLVVFGAMMISVRNLSREIKSIQTEQVALLESVKETQTSALGAKEAAKEAAVEVARKPTVQIAVDENEEPVLLVEAEEPSPKPQPLPPSNKAVAGSKSVTRIPIRFRSGDE